MKPSDFKPVPSSELGPMGGAISVTLATLGAAVAIVTVAWSLGFTEGKPRRPAHEFLGQSR
jgi:hypothetical protein